MAELPRSGEEPDRCAPYREQIESCRAKLAELQGDLDWMDPRVDRVQMRRVQQQIDDLERQIAGVQAQATAAGCGPL